MPFDKYLCKFDIKLQIWDYIQIRDLPFLSECLLGTARCVRGRTVVSSQATSHYLNISCYVWYPTFFKTGIWDFLRKLSRLHSVKAPVQCNRIYCAGQPRDLDLYCSQVWWIKAMNVLQDRKLMELGVSLNDFVMGSCPCVSCSQAWLNLKYWLHGN